MAEPVVSFAVERIGDLLFHESKFLHGVREQVELLQTELKGMQCFLKDADKRQGQNESVRNWVSEIRDAAYDAEDVIETFALKVASRRSGGIQNVLKRYSFIFNECVQLHKVGSEIESIKTRISNLSRSLKTYGINPISESSSSGYEWLRQLRRSYSHVIEEDTVGLDEDVKKLVEYLVNEKKQCRVVSVCGMGGLGKTTLAKKVYHHKDVRRYFDGFAWAYISQQLRAREVLQEIAINLLSPSDEERKKLVKMSDEELVKKIHEVQRKKKCLVILDDIWSIGTWEILKAAFPDQEMHSKILLTTRNKEIVGHVRASLHEPRFLNEDESWELLRKKAFAGQDGPDTKMELGRKMVKQCAGLPLAIVVLGGLLATKQTLIEWNTVHENINSCLEGKGHGEQHLGVFEVLALSYNELPYQLKPCFLHLSNFPEDFEIPKKKLIRMWVAEGIVSPPPVRHVIRTKELLEDVAERYLGELIERCMVQVGERGSTGRVKTCRLHDLMRDLCLSKAQQEHFLGVINLRQGNQPMDSSFSSSSRVRRLAIDLGNDTNFLFKHETTSSHLRSLSFFYTTECEIYNWQKMKFVFNDFKLLRVLDFEGLGIFMRIYPEQ